MDYASEVEERGIFILYFTGHAITVKGLDGKGAECILALADFKGDISSSITAENIKEWQNAKLSMYWLY